ncbi:MAG: HD domain-containing protein [Planctomycetota bacterium]|jgi:putative nucleotidyltransferase with HDIG domain
MSSMKKCPGQDPAFMKARDVAEVHCPQCGHMVEFWPDELMRRCVSCGNRFPNPENSMKCLEWCRYAAQCMAALRGADDSWLAPLRTELIERMKGAFGEDEHKIEHALAVLSLAEEIGAESESDPLVLVPAAILHDIGRAEPQGGPGQADHGEGGRHRAAEMLADLGFPGAIEEQILDLIEHHHEREWMDRPNGRALFDADLIVNLGEDEEPRWPEALDGRALTEAGRRIGREALSG